MNSSEDKKDRFAPLTYEQMYGVEEPEPDGRPLELEIDSLVPFPNQPFNPYTEDDMAKMVESIQENGVISPIIVRPKADGETYEIISGHNRVEACRRAGICKIPSFIREVDDDTAVILMVDSNLRQREKLLPSEKALAYKMKLEAMKRTAGRPKKENAPQPAANYRSDDAAAEAFGVSGDTVRRYVRLTELIPELLDCMDRGEMALSVGEALSYLGEDMQYAVLDAMDAEGCTPSYAQAVRMKNMFRDGTLTEAAVAELLSERKANQKERISFPLDDLQRFFPPQYTPEQIRQSILRMLEEKEEREKEHRSRSREVER